MPDRSAPRRLLAILGVTFGIAVTIGNVIGAGILRTPGEIAKNLPAVWPYLSVWIIGGLYALLGANALAELATRVPRSGGQYVFVRHALGDYAGFVVGWSDWLSTCGTTALVSITIGEYALVYVPSLRAFEVIALLTVGLLTLVQWLGIRWGGAAQNVTSLLKGIVLVALIAACFHLGGRNPFRDSFSMESETSLFAAFLLSLQAVIYTYDGWTAIIYFSEEVRNPARDIPRSMFSGVGLVIAIYLLINVAFLRVVPLGSIGGEKLAAGVVAQHLFGPYADSILRVLFIIALLSAVNSNVLMAPRVLFAMASDGLFWRGAREVNRGGTPDIALLISSVVAVAFVVTGTFETVIAKLSFFFVANYTLSFVSLFVLRRGGQAILPDQKEQTGQAGLPVLHFRAWGHPLTTAIALIASVAFLGAAVAADPTNSVWTLGLLALSYPAYRLAR
jgi:basic amino acid/polyamine antiporter, APA family